ncbi:MAG: glucosaminidase domain-containing protein [Alphaproteobacteria bacterium]|nr:glucosaminidase domain-containing protein [Alphaproteobacteria bacterium]
MASYGALWTLSVAPAPDRNAWPILSFQILELPPTDAGRESLAEVQAALAQWRFELDGAEGRGSAADMAIPSVFVPRLPRGLAELADGPERKSLFVRIVLPLVLRVNEDIAADRARLRAIAARAKDGGAIPRDDAAWLAALGARYRVELANAEKPDAMTLSGLLRRVDGLPVALALGQAAIESGWGGSRFAAEGNALFGMWTWDPSEGMVPRERLPGKTHLVRRFDTLLAGVRAYMHNLNTHPAYAELRARRQQQRQALAAQGAWRSAEAPLHAASLAAALGAYSEKRAEYVTALKGLIAANDLHRFEVARLIPAVPVRAPARPSLACVDTRLPGC